MTQYTMHSDHRSLFGMDVHARSVSVRGIDLATGETAQKRFVNCPTPAELASWMKATFSGAHYAAYESGCTGFYLCRELRSLGIDCDVVAVSSIARSVDDRRRKDDKRDAKRLLQELLIPDSSLSKVWLPDEECECMRDLARTYHDLVVAQIRLKQQTSALLLRHGYIWNERTLTGKPKATWGKDHNAWLNTAELPHQSAQDALMLYLTSIKEGKARIASMNGLIRKYADGPRWKPYVDALQCLKGLDLYSAFLCAAEFGDFERFGSGGSVSNWIGVTPSSNASGGKTEAKGSITKAGNFHVRTTLVEGVANIAGRTSTPKVLKADQVVSDPVRTVCNQANKRIQKRYGHFISEKKKPQVAKIAVVNELARWIWVIGCMVQKEQRLIR